MIVKYYLQQSLFLMLMLASVLSYGQNSDKQEISVGQKEQEPGLSRTKEDQSVNEPASWPKSVPKTDRVESFVMPFTHWVEKKVQSSSIFNPSTKKADKSENIKGVLSLRQAIEKARENNPGTVLSAQKVKRNEHLDYKIKILTEGGVIKMITISGTQTKPTKNVKSLEKTKP